MLCVLMTTLLLAGGGQAGGNEAEELALTIRGEHLGMDRCTAQVSVTADYGQRVYEYEMAVAVTGEETLLVLSAPETVAGLTARISGEDSALEFDGLSVETGPLDRLCRPCPAGGGPVGLYHRLWLGGGRDAPPGGLRGPGGHARGGHRDLPVVRCSGPRPGPGGDLGGRILRGPV